MATRQTMVTLLCCHPVYKYMWSGDSTSHNPSVLSTHSHMRPPYRCSCTIHHPSHLSRLMRLLPAILACERSSPVATLRLTPLESALHSLPVSVASMICNNVRRRRICRWRGGAHHMPYHCQCTAHNIIIYVHILCFVYLSNSTLATRYARSSS